MNTKSTPLNLDQIRRNVTALATMHPQIVADTSALIAHIRHLETVNQRLRVQAAAGELWRLAAEAVTDDDAPTFTAGGIPGLTDAEARAYLAALAGEEDAEGKR